MGGDDIVVLGATGFTGQLVARELVKQGVRPRLAGRSAEKLIELSDELGDLPFEVVELSNGIALAGALRSARVLISTVGPFSALGDPALEAALALGADYLDCAGEPAFIRRVFEDLAPQAVEARCSLIPAMGYDFAVGNLAGALALTEAGAAATRLRVGYINVGVSVPSRGTMASVAHVQGAQSFIWRGGRLEGLSGPVPLLDLRLESETYSAFPFGGTEHLSLPRLFPHLANVDVGIGSIGGFTQPEGAGPTAEQRAASRSLVFAVASDASGADLVEVRLDGGDPYDLTASWMAWAALELMRVRAPAGVLGPVEAFGLPRMLSAVELTGAKISVSKPNAH